MKKIIIAILLIIPFYANSQKLIANRDSVQGAYNFWVYIPNATIRFRTPLLPCFFSTDEASADATCRWCANTDLLMLF